MPQIQENKFQRMDKEYWLHPCEESFYLANHWKQAGFQTVLDLGCGHGRHAIHFAKNGFQVSAMDIKEDSIAYLQEWAKRENTLVKAEAADMLELPYEDNSFDCVFAYHVIYHTDTAGARRAIDEIHRVLRPGGEFYVTMCSKDAWAYKKAAFPGVDVNTILRSDRSTDMGVPHFYVELEDVFSLFRHFTINRIRHIDDCYFDHKVQNSKHYFIHGCLDA